MTFMKSIKIFLFALLLAITNLLASDIQSNSRGGGDWNSPSTWLGGIVPNSEDNVIIVGNDIIVVNSDIDIQSLFISNSATLKPNTEERKITLSNDLFAIDFAKIDYSNSDGKLNWVFTGIADGKSIINIQNSTKVLFNNIEIKGSTHIATGTVRAIGIFEMKCQCFSIASEQMLYIGN